MQILYSKQRSFKLAIKITFVAILFFCLDTRAQSNLVALKIGDKVPDITINNIVNYKGQNGKPATSAKISDFKDKLIILDFWATWCSPCIAMIPKMDSLQKEFVGKVQFLPISYQSKNEVESFLSKIQKQNGKQYDLPDVTNDKVLSKLFPHRLLPHYIWIDGKGIVRAITELKDINRVKIRTFLKTGEINAWQKIDARVSYDKHQPLLINGNGGDGSNLLFHSLITGYKDGLPSAARFDPLDTITMKTRKVTATNNTIADLFALAYGGDRYWFGQNKMIFEVKDTTKLTTKTTGSEFEDWMKKGNSLYSYEIVVPSFLAKNVFNLMINDLSRYFFQYDVKIQKIPVKCLALVRTSAIDKIHSKGGQTVTDFNRLGCRIVNNYLNQLTGRLDVMYLQGKYPVVNATNYNAPVDIIIDANLSDVTSINGELKKYDLELRESIQPIEMVVFKDKNND